jgi:hypothetical protein
VCVCVCVCVCVYCIEQAQQWDTERESRDKIESDLRAQIFKYETIMEANEKKHSHFVSQVQQLTDQLNISEHTNSILMEENKKHVKDFEHFKAQLEFHKSVGNSNSSSVSSHISTSKSQQIVAPHSVHRADEVVADVTSAADFASEKMTNVETTGMTKREMHLNQAFQTEVT